MKLIINGNHIEAQEGDSVLEAALASGIYIPHLCKHPDLEAVGGCRLCSVEIEGAQEAVPSCMTMVSEGMVVRTDSEKANATRKAAMELILASHPADCTGCPKYGKCELQSLYQYMGVSPEKWRKKSRTFANDDSNPLISHLFTRCIRCGRCIRACRELRGVKVLDFQKTKDGVRAGIEEGKTLKEAGCQFCGACIEVCPTGSIMDAVGIIRENVSYSDSVVPCRSACPASIDIPRYVRYIRKGDFSKAAAVAREKVPFPEILGNICNHACEDACKRNELNKPVSVCRLKRAAAANDDLSWKAKSLRSESTGKKAAVIGAGPAGLFAANMEASLLLQLKRRGFEGSCAWRLLTEAKEELTAGRYGECAKLLNISDAEFKAAFSLLRSLDPAPGANFSYAAAVVPEIEFIVEEGAVRPRLILENMPAVENYFADFEASPRDLIRAGWARGEWSAARGALKKLGLRYRTLLRAALLIADVQKEKIRAPEKPPAALSYENAASLLALHTSTVYRAMQNTWCSIGGRSYPMNIFFCRASAGKKSSVAQMRQKIFALRAEGLSNKKIGELLEMRERTVAYHSAKNAKKMRG